MNRKKPEEILKNQTHLTACGMPWDGAAKLKINLPEESRKEIEKLINEMADIWNQPRPFKDD